MLNTVDRLYQDEVAVLRNNLDITTRKFKMIEKEQKSRLELESSKISELVAAMDQVESNGNNYLSLIKKMKEAILTEAKQRSHMIVENANEEADQERARLYNAEKEKIQQ